MYKYLLLLLLILTHALSFAQEEMSIAVRIKHTKDQVSLLRLEQKDVIPAITKDQNIENIIAGLSPGEEAVVRGHIRYDSKANDDSVSYQPIFVIESVSPVSLGKLSAHSTVVPDLFFKDQDKVYAPVGIPVSTEIASAMTMTTALLLMQGLTTSSGDPQGRRDINSSLILFSGVLITGSLILEQFLSPKPVQ